MEGVTTMMMCSSCGVLRGFMKVALQGVLGERSRWARAWKGWACGGLSPSECEGRLE